MESRKLFDVYIIETLYHQSVPQLATSLERKQFIWLLIKQAPFRVLKAPLQGTELKNNSSFNHYLASI